MARAATGLPFDDIRRLMDGPPLPDIKSADALKENCEAGLGKLQELGEWMAAWQGRAVPSITQPLIGVFAANHGLVAQQVTLDPMSETQAQVELIAAGGVAVSRAAMQSNVGLKVFDLALDIPTPDITTEDAFDEAGCAATMAFGMEAIAGGADLLCVSGIGVGNRIVAGALAFALFGGAAGDWLPEEPNDTLRQNQLRSIDAAVARLNGETADPLAVLRQVGGREFAAIAGAILAARYQQIPVLLDGMVSVASAAILQAVNPTSVAHCRVCDRSDDPGMERLLRETGFSPIFDLRLAQSNGLAGVLAIDMCRTAAVAIQGRQ